MAGLSLMGALVAASLGQFCISGHWGTLVAAGLDLVPIHTAVPARAFSPSFNRSPQSGPASAGLLSDWLGLAWAMELTLLVGFFSGFLILWVARGSYLADYKRRRGLEDSRPCNVWLAPILSWPYTRP